jgi:hypothetical protein
VIDKSLVAPLLKNPITLSASEFSDLVRFVRDGLLDARVLKPNLCGLIPRAVPSGLTVMEFEGCGR